MKLKGLTQKDVQRLSGGKITDGYVASITTGRAGNLSVDKLRALADGLGVDLDDLFHVASGRPKKLGEGKKSKGAPDPLVILEIVQKVVASPDVTEILNEVVRLSSEERASVLGFIKRLGTIKRKARRKAKLEGPAVCLCRTFQNNQRSSQLSSVMRSSPSMPSLNTSLSSRGFPSRPAARPFPSWSSTLDTVRQDRPLPWSCLSTLEYSAHERVALPVILPAIVDNQPDEPRAGTQDSHVWAPQIEGWGWIVFVLSHNGSGRT
jgi:transcriptional regulator with XRE-family HTH domain